MSFLITCELKNKRPTWCHLLFYFTSYIFNMFRILIYPSSGACNTGTTQTQPHQISNIQRTENKTTDVVIQQHSRKLLMMDILISETSWVHKKWNKIASDIKLVFYSSTITMMHGPIDIRFTQWVFGWSIYYWPVGLLSGCIERFTEILYGVSLDTELLSNALDITELEEFPPPVLDTVKLFYSGNSEHCKYEEWSVICNY